MNRQVVAPTGFGALFPDDRTLLPQNKLLAARVKDLACERREVLVRGQLMYDNLHLVNKDPSNLKRGQPKRFSPLEVHPVTDIYVCLARACDPSDIGQWQLRVRRRSEQRGLNRHRGLLRAAPLVEPRL
jgi:hypothetical protein